MEDHLFRKTPESLHAMEQFQCMKPDFMQTNFVNYVKGKGSKGWLPRLPEHPPLQHRNAFSLADVICRPFWNRQEVLIPKRQTVNGDIGYIAGRVLQECVGVQATWLMGRKVKQIVSGETSFPPDLILKKDAKLLEFISFSLSRIHILP